MGSVRRSFVRAFAPIGALSTFASSALLSAPASAQDVPLRRVHQMVPPAGAYASVAGNWDGDGDLDLAARGLVWLENVDHGALEARTIPGAFSDFPLLAADLDGDARTDMVSSPVYYGNDVRVWTNRGDSPFSTPPAVVLSTAYRSFAAAEAGDLDADGDQDVYLFANSYTPDTVLFNDGSAGFPVQGTALSPQAKSSEVELADFDRDGDLDVLRSGAGVEVWSNDGSGAFSLSPIQPPPVGTWPLQAGDVDLDGDVDFLADNPPHLFLNSGEGRFADDGVVLPKLDIYPVRNFHFIDVDDDELPDVLATPDPSAHGYPQKFVGCLFFRNNGRARFEALPGLFLPESINVIADLDGDHDRDLIGYASDVELWLNDGRGSFTNTRDPWQSELRTEKVVVGDLDGDRFPDVLAWEDKGVFQNQWPTVLYRSLRNGAFVEETLPLVPAGYPVNPCLGDVDLDGDLDVYTLSSVFGVRTPVLLENDGRAGFTPVSGRFPSLAPTYSSGLADLDLDGDPDLLVVDFSFGPKRTPMTQGRSWLNDGLGVFSESGKALPSRNVYGGPALLADIDGDTDLDAWVLVGGLLWANDGTGGFGDVTPSSPGYLTGYTGAFADMDRDGDIDALSKSDYCQDGDCYGFAAVLLNDGLGRFSPGQGYWDYDPYSDFGNLSVADIDEDGDIDVLTSNCKLWENDGTGRLEDESYELTFCVPSYYTYITPYFPELAIEDLDRDGDPDVWYPGLTRPAMNTLRHVSWRSYPRAGKPLTMEVFGPANTPYRLFSSAGFTEPQATDYGFLRLATDGARLVATGTLEASGKTAVTLGVPADLAIPENTVYWQAIVGSPPRLTNLEFTRFSNL